MSATPTPRQMLSDIMNDLPEAQKQHIINCIVREAIGYDEDEPPLTEDEIEGLEIGKQELAEGKGIPFSEVLKELWE